MRYGDRPDRISEAEPAAPVERTGRRDPWSAALGVEPVRWRDLELSDDRPAADAPGDQTPVGKRGPDNPEQVIHVDHPDLPAEPPAPLTWREMPRRGRDGAVERPPLFDGPPRREQARQGALNDCGVIATLGAVAERRPDAIRDAVREREDGTYEVRLHEVEERPDGSGWVPTGRPINVLLSPDVPVSLDEPDHAEYADTQISGTAWAAAMEKALAVVDHSWPRGRLDREGDEAGYARLDKGSTFSSIAETMGQLTGKRTQVLRLDSSPDAKWVLETLSNLIGAGEPVVVGTLPGDRFSGLRDHGLVGSHAYEVVAVEGDEIELWNPWGGRHPDKITAQQFRNNLYPNAVTIVNDMARGTRDRT